MPIQVITLLFFSVCFVWVAAQEPQPRCSDVLTACKETYDAAIAEVYDDWNIVQTYIDCVDAVDCPENEDLKAEFTEDYESAKRNWGREWNVRDTAPCHSSSSVLAVMGTIATIGLYYFL